ncbi:MAG: hypothetical protein A4E71_01184 [Smithella sp. PtaU1.Bin162]|jgi:hypothetical protein|nr:MAG: hypothetical protein A4E71_01184 [Smithella sp. PtaU1.Bin162]
MFLSEPETKRGCAKVGETNPDGYCFQGRKNVEILKLIGEVAADSGEYKIKRLIL